MRPGMCYCSFSSLDLWGETEKNPRSCSLKCVLPSSHFWFSIEVLYLMHWVTIQKLLHSAWPRASKFIFTDVNSNLAGWWCLLHTSNLNSVNFPCKIQIIAGIKFSTRKQTNRSNVCYEIKETQTSSEAVWLSQVMSLNLALREKSSKNTARQDYRISKREVGKIKGFSQQDSPGQSTDFQFQLFP